MLCGLLASGVAGANGRVVVDLPLPMPTASAADAASGATEQSPQALVVAPAPVIVTGPRTNPPEPPVEKTPTPAAMPPDSARTIQFTLSKGQSLYEQFLRYDLDRSALVAMVRHDRRIKKALRRLRPGQRIQVRTLDDGRIQDLLMERPGPKDLLISRTKDSRFRIQDVEDRPFAASEQVPLPGATGETNITREDDAAASPTVAALTPVSTPGFEPPPSEEQAPSDTDADPQMVGIVGNAPSAVHRVTVKPGDSLFRIFRRLDIPPQDLARLLASDKQARRLRNLQPGQELSLALTHDKRLHGVRAELDEENTLAATRSADNSGYRVEVTHRPLERRVATASAVIENSLFLAGQRAGLSDRTIMRLTEIFGWDVDFALDVRAGDRFTVIHEEFYKDGEKVRDGPILASEFINRGRSVRAIRFVDDSGRSAYYSPKGLSMRKAFLRTPVRFSRISSRFSRGRMHPVLNRMRAHKGVDYAAPTGTAINATGDGRIVFAGRKGGYGRTVVIQHGSTYTTLYAHMSQLHRRARVGSRVRQGDTIGYVGRSGLATGPHLHYEFRVRGHHVDPLRVKLPKALPIEARYKAAFLRASRPLVSQLDTLASTNLASRD